MDHMRTWPDFYINNETVLFHEWDLSDLENIISNIIEHTEQRLDIAQAAQKTYLSYTSHEDAFERFMQHFLSIINFKGLKNGN